MTTVCKYQSQMSRSSWFDFTTAILGLMRKRASPCWLQRVTGICRTGQRWTIKKRGGMLCGWASFHADRRLVASAQAYDLWETETIAIRTSDRPLYTVNWLDYAMQTEFNVQNIGNVSRDLFNVKRSIANVRPGSWQLTAWITCWTR